MAEKPDLFLHAGDLFDGVRPGNRALAHAMEGFLKLSRAGIPTVVVAGNHEHPKLRETGSPFRLFEHLPNIHLAYRGRRETFLVETAAGPVRIHAVPQCATAQELAGQVADAPTRADGLDILVAHGSVPGLAAFSHGEFNEQSLDPAWFPAFDHVALGHFHGFQQVAPNAWYCGAPERVSMAEAAEEKGFLEVRIASDGPEAKFRALDGRLYVDLPPIDAQGMDAATAKAAATAAIAKIPAGSVGRLRLVDLDPSLRGSLEVRAIRQAAAELLHLDLRLEWGSAGVDAGQGGETRGILPDFDAFAAQQPMEPKDRPRVLALARTLLEATP